MALSVTSSPNEELLTDEEAKRSLHLLTSDWDTEIRSLVQAARDYCERFTGRTLRTSVTRTWKKADWWGGDLRLPWPPLISVTSITYYDADNASQTLGAGNYHVVTSTDGGGRLVWSDTAVLPDVYERPDAITITFTTGYANLAALPPVALQAMKTKLRELWGSGTDNEMKAAKEATDRLLGLVDWTGYA